MRPSNKYNVVAWSSWRQKYWNKTCIESSKGVAGGQHALDEIDWIQESPPGHIVRLLVKIGCEIEGDVITQLVSSAKNKGWDGS